jgi:uncharacterized SAM-binding protein YcdF (DUF218 family)
MPSETLNTASDGIVLLGGNYSERAPKAADLYKKGYATRILLANDGVRGGWSRKHQRNLYNIERSEELLVQLGVPSEAIIKLPYDKSGTFYDALAVKKYASEHGLHSIHLITSDYHAYRALWVFKRAFGKMPVTIGITAAPSPLFSLSSLKEPFKLVFYWLRY